MDGNKAGIAFRSRVVGSTVFDGGVFACLFEPLTAVFLLFEAAKELARVEGL